MTPTAVLAQCALRLRAASPKDWDAFVEVFDAYSTEITVAVVSAPQDQVLVAQGKAQAFLHLLDTFRYCQLRAQPPAKPPSAPVTGP